MRNFLSLLKVQIKQMFGTIFFKRKSRSTISVVLLVMLFIGGIGGSLASLYIQLAKEFSAVGMTEMLFLQAGIMSLMLVILLITLQAQSFFFKTKDYEFLASLPLKSTQIVFAKLVAVLFTAYLYTIMTFVPAIIVYFCFAGFNVGIFFLCILALIFFPFLPSAVGILLGLIFAYISSKTTKSTLVNFILTLIFCGIYIYFSTAFNSFIEIIVSKGNDILTAFTYVLPSIGLFITGFIQLNIWHILIYLALNIISLCLITYFVSLQYNQINLSLNRTVFKIQKGELQYNKQPVMKVLLKNELKRYVSISIYVFNTFFMGLMAVIFPLIIYFSGTVDDWGLSGMNALLPHILTMIVTIMLASFNTACVSISIEGTKFAGLKAMPISANKIFASKILFNQIIAIPMSLLSNIVVLTLFHTSFALDTTLAIIILPILAICASSVYGLVVNLYFPKMKYDNYTQVVKQSASSFLGIFGGMFIGAIPFTIYFSAFYGTMSYPLFTIITASLYISIITVCAIILKTKGQKLYNRIIA